MAEQEVIADLAGIKEELKKLGEAAKEAAKNTKSIGEKLKFDTNNVELIGERFASLGNELSANKKLVEQYNAALKKLKERKTELEGIADATEKQKEEYKKVRADIDKYEKALDKAGKSVEYLTAATQDQVKEQALLRAATKDTKERFEQLGKAATALSATMLAIVGAFAKIAQSAIEQGKELYNLSIRYDSNTEDIQKWNRALQIATGESDLFTASVNTMIKGLSQISAGRGVAYQQALRNIGLSYRELADLDTAERFERIVRALGDTADANVRLEAAQQLLGESGQSIANMFEEEGFALDEFLAKADKFGYITQDNAEKLNNMSIELEAAKSQISLAGAELTTALAPAIKAIADIITNVIAPALKSLANWFNNISPAGQKILLFLSGVVIILPKIVIGLSAFITAVGKLRKQVRLLNIATSKWQIIFTAVSLVIIGIIELIAIFSSRARNALDDVKNLQNASNSLMSAGEDYGGNIESVVSSSTMQTIQIEATIDAKGDTPISDENASKVAQIMNDSLAEQLNRIYGGYVK